MGDMTVPKLTYSVPQVCRALQISRTPLWKLVRSRRLKPVRIGRRVLFSLKSVEELLSNDRGGHRSRYRSKTRAARAVAARSTLWRNAGNLDPSCDGLRLQLSCLTRGV